MRRLAVILALAGCGSHDPDAPDAPAGSDAAAPDAPPSGDPTVFGDLMPHAVGSNKVIAAPKVVAISWANDPNRTDYETFFTQYAASPAWAAQASEYGVGALTVAAPGRLAANAPATLTEPQLISTVLVPNLTGATPAWGAPDASTLYEVAIPQAMSYDDGSGAKCCTDYLGYHYDTTIAGVDVAFAVNCACTGGGLTVLQNLTETANHETVEAATDPLGDGWAQTDDAHFAWTFVTGGETSDLCEYADTASEPMPAGMTYGIQRSWSNAAAQASLDPCVPAGTSPYYQAIPETPDTVTIPHFGASVTTRATKIAKGSSGTLTLHIYANPATGGPFTVTVDDWSGIGGGTKLLSITQPSGTFNVGDTVAVPVTVFNTDPNLGNKAEAYQVTLKPATGPATYYYGLISQ